MLTETFVAATSAPEKDKGTNTAQLGVHIHELQPLPALKATFKKSSTKTNCLAVSRTHIFAAQADKAVVHVFNREKNNLEAIVPFPERICSLALAGGKDAAGVLALGTEGGRIILWELGTGRQVSTPQHHLQPVTRLTIDVTSNFVLSGSPDSNIHVWSLLELLSFSNTQQSGLGQSTKLAPLRSLSAHRDEITALVVGHSGSNQDIAVSASKDKTCVVWEYRAGAVIRTYLLQDTPICMALDPVDRAVYVGYEDGSVHLIDFFKDAGLTHPLQKKPSDSSGIQAPSSDRWVPAPESMRSAVLCLDVSYDGTKLVSGHENGKICVWDVTKGSSAAPIMDCSCPVTNLVILEPTGFPYEKPPSVKLHSVVKPRYESFTTDNRSESGASVPVDYTFSAQFTSSLDFADSSPDISFQELLTSPTFPQSMLDECLSEFQHSKDEESSIANLSAIADLQKEKTALETQLQSAKREIERRDREAWAQKQDQDIKAAKKKRRRLQRISADEVRRKKEMGEKTGGEEDHEMEEVEDEEEDLSSSTDEMLDTE